MKINILKQVVLLNRASGITTCVWGHRGIGKSSVIRQITEEHRLGFIDMRCSQLEASDIRGLPDRVEGRTSYLPPEDMPIGDMEWAQYEKKLKDTPEEDRYKMESVLQPRLKEGILFLDELNRAQDDVLQAVFQLVLDRRVGRYVLPPGWNIVVAGNFMEGYMVNGFTDPAFLNRFCHVTLSDGETTLDEWVDYIANNHSHEHSGQVIEFASQNVKHLDGDVQGELGFTIQPSRRSWEAVIRLEKIYREAMGHISDEARIEAIAGLIGRELALAYSRHSCPVKPRDLIQHGVEKMEAQLKRLNRNQMTGLMWGLVGFVKPHLDDDKYATVALDFAGFVCQHCKEKDLAVAFCKAMVAGDGSSTTDRLREATISNPKLARLLAKHGGGDKKKKSFIDRLAANPQLHDIVAKTAWGGKD